MSLSSRMVKAAVSARLSAVLAAAALFFLALACQAFNGTVTREPAASPLPLASTSPQPLPPTATPTVLPPATGEPTTSPATLTGSGLPALGPVPTSAEELSDWLLEAWRDGQPPGGVRDALIASEWLRGEEDWLALDLDHDGREEWLVTYYRQDADVAEPGSPVTGGMFPGNLWVLNGNGILYQAFESHEESFQSAPRVVAVADLTGDGWAEAVSETVACGAHTCFYTYQVISAHHGFIAPIVSAPPDQPEWSEGINMSYARLQIVDATGDEVADAVVRGGTFGSVGAGIQREREEIWSWNGEAIALAHVEWEETGYRFHILYNANFAFENGDVETARLLYERVVHDDTLDDAEDYGWFGNSHDASRQFAAFRLVLLHLQQPTLASAVVWRDWLLTEYPETPIAEAADLLLSNWLAHEDIAAACIAVTNQLLTADSPTGPLADMGYGNPSLDADDLCPLR
jgi:hypothetical protein